MSELVKTMMAPASQQFRLVFESLAPTIPPENLAIPTGVSFLFAPLDQTPQLLSVSPEAFDDILILEPIFTTRKQRLLLALNPAGGLFLVNGQPVPSMAMLAEKDEFSLNHGRAFFVTLFNQRRVGPPDSALVGKPCPVCRAPFREQSRVYHCVCGAGIHDQSANEEVGTLDCLPLCEEGFCPVCRSQPIIAQDGFTWLPDLTHA
jgi:hypothetical protein